MIIVDIPSHTGKVRIQSELKYTLYFKNGDFFTWPWVFLCFDQIWASQILRITLVTI